MEDDKIYIEVYGFCEFMMGRFFEKFCFFWGFLLIEWELLLSKEVWWVLRRLFEIVECGCLVFCEVVVELFCWCCGDIL